MAISVYVLFMGFASNTLRCEGRSGRCISAPLPDSRATARRQEKKLWGPRLHGRVNEGEGESWTAKRDPEKESAQPPQAELGSKSNTAAGANVIQKACQKLV